jgi:hypothetical protein
VRVAVELGVCSTGIRRQLLIGVIGRGGADRRARETGRTGFGTREREAPINKPEDGAWDLKCSKGVCLRKGERERERERVVW